MHVLVTLATVCALLGTALAAPLDAWLLKMKAGLSLELRPRADGGHGSEAFVRSAGGAGVKGGAAVASIPSSLILTKNTAEATFGADLVAEIGAVDDAPLQLALLLMLEKGRGEESLFHPFISTLPQQFSTTVGEGKSVCVGGGGERARSPTCFHVS